MYIDDNIYMIQNPKDKVSKYGYDNIKLPSIIYQDKSKSKVIVE